MYTLRSQLVRFAGTSLGILAVLLVTTTSVYAAPVSWKTNYASLEADELVIKANGKEFYGTNAVSVSSDPGDDNYTTLETIWNDQDVAMRMFIYFSKTGDTWNVTEVRTYDGKTPGDWIYYNGFTGGKVNEYLDLDSFTLFPRDGQPGEITFTHLKLLGFVPKNFPTPSPGSYILDILYDPVELSNAPNTGFGTNVILRNPDQSVVTNQTNFTYQWVVADPKIADLFIGAYCFYGTTPPCPFLHADITGYTSGITQATVTVTDKTTQQVVAQSGFTIKVTESTQTTSIATPTPRPIFYPTPTATLSAETKINPEVSVSVTPVSPASELVQAQTEIKQLQAKVNQQETLIVRLEKMVTQIVKMLRSALGLE